ncbi:MAG: DUF433 domain-containing protein [Phycisphaerae bacterium]|nr:DUF433 domain-containing protein [Phycisphaerae bacterium]
MPPQDRIVRDRAICGGEPVIRGTRVTRRTGTRWMKSSRVLRRSRVTTCTP